MKRYGGSSGHPPGPAHREYLQYVLSRITLPGSIYLDRWPCCRTCSCRSRRGAEPDFPFGGTAVLIMVGVGWRR